MNLSPLVSIRSLQIEECTICHICIMHLYLEVMSPCVFWVLGLGGKGLLHQHRVCLLKISAVTSNRCLFPASSIVVAIMSWVKMKIASLSSKGWLELNFYRVHIIYFLLTIILSSIIMYGSGIHGNAEASFKLRYIDAIFLCTSAMTSTGLATINLNNLTGFQQSILFILIPIGNTMVIANAAVWIRRHFLRRHMKEILKHSKAAREVMDRIDTERGILGSLATDAIHSVSSGIRRLPRATGLQTVQSSITHYRRSHHEIGHGGLPYPWEWEIGRKWKSKLTGPANTGEGRVLHYLSFQPSFDEKVQFPTSVRRLSLTISRVAFSPSASDKPRSSVV